MSKQSGRRVRLCAKVFREMRNFAESHSDTDIGAALLDAYAAHFLAGGLLRTSTRPTLNPILLLRVYV